jgi:arabinofuranosyltransferase
MLAVSFSLLCALALFNWNHTVDDAFITFRYAENLVQGRGPVFNPGERVEGYTNFLWMILLAPFLAASADPVTVTKILGLVASMGTLAAVVRFAPRLTGDRDAAWLAPLLLASSPPFVVWTTGGMETPLFTCLLTWAVVLAADEPESTAPGPAVGALLGIASLVRPEGTLAALVVLAGGAALSPRTPESRRSIQSTVAVYLILFLPYFCWRWWYYGYLLPNTFYAKVGTGWSQMVRGLQYTHAFFAFSGYGLLLPLIGLRRFARRPAVRLLGGLVAVLLGYTVLVGGDALPMFRFLVPLLPAFFLLLALGVTGILESPPFRPWLRPALLGACALLALWAARIGFVGAPYEDVARDAREVAAWRQVGGWLRDHARADATVAVIPAGAIPYVSKLRAIDMLGLNDVTIAHRVMPDLGSGLPGHEKFDVEYVLSRKPDIVILGVYGLDPEPKSPQDLVRYSYEAEWRMLDSPRFQNEYVLRRARAPGGYFAYFVRVR